MTPARTVARRCLPLLVLPALLCAACAPAGSEPDQFARGQALYAVHCAHCHEVESGMGPKLTEHVLATRVSADALFRYTRRFMPYEAGNTLSEQQYWDITGYLLQRYGFVEAGVDVGAETAAGIRLGD